jgi:hypothetical protein
MKNLTFVCLLALTLFSSCEDKGVTNVSLIGNEDQLPEELKGLKVYSVSLGEGKWITVAKMDNQPTSATYNVGKTQASTIFIQKENREIEIESIISENDSIMVIKKKRK